MTEEKFKKGIKEFRETRLTVVEKSAMLEKIFKAQIESPYSTSYWYFNIFQKPLTGALLVMLIMITGTSVAYTAEHSLPGETLYAVKTQVFEPIRDLVNTSPIQKLEWEEKKVERRIMEAEELAKNNKLDEKRTRELEQKIERSSAAFSAAAKKVASSTATTTSGRDRQEQEIKKSLRAKLEEKKSVWITVDLDEEKKNKDENDDDEEEENNKNKESRIKRIKDRAVKALDDDEEDDDRRDNSRGGDRD